MEIFFFIVNSKTGRIFEISAVTTGYRHGSKFYHFVYDYGDLMWTTYLILVFFYIDDPYDDMTGLYNRRGFIRAAEDAVALSRGKMNMILVRDVINFQDVNERFGRDIGDEAIIGISRKLYEKYHNVAEIGYLGSDNFVLCLSDINYQANSDPNKLASYVQSELESDYEIEFSDGIYQIGDQKMDVLLMIDRAIYAHNKTKSNYNNHVSTFDQKMAEEFSMQSYINHNMKKALANKEFKVYFQPIYDSHSKKIIISSIMDMTDRLDMPIITEGVENEQQYNYLKSLKCVQIQGFYFSTPAPKEEFEKLLLENEL
jgi:diguanylate cyclase (GGDEF)-like protein